MESKSQRAGAERCRVRAHCGVARCFRRGGGAGSRGEVSSRVSAGRTMVLMLESVAVGIGEGGHFADLGLGARGRKEPADGVYARERQRRAATENTRTPFAEVIDKVCGACAS